MWKLVSKSVVFGLTLPTIVEKTLDGWLWHKASDLKVRVLRPDPMITLLLRKKMHSTLSVPKQKKSSSKWVAATYCWGKHCKGLSSDQGGLIQLLIARETGISSNYVGCNNFHFTFLKNTEMPKLNKKGILLWNARTWATASYHNARKWLKKHKQNKPLQLIEDQSQHSNLLAVTAGLPLQW